MPREGRPSKWWYLLPIFLNLIGGVIGYFAVKDRDRKFAEKLLIAGLVMLVFWWIVGFAVAGMLATYLTSVAENISREAAKVSIIDVSDATCSGGTIIAVVRNLGPDTVSFSELKFYIDGYATQSCPGEIQPGSAASCPLAIPTGSRLISAHQITVVGPLNTANSSVFCIV